jgi:hypothetical protein
MPRFVAWFLVLLLLAAFGGAAAWVLRAHAEAGKGLPAYSVYSDGEDGLAEAAHLLGRLGWAPVAVTRPVPPGRNHGLLIVAQPGGGGVLSAGRTPLSAGEAKALLAWVEQGNTLLLSSRGATPLHEELGVAVTEDRSDDKGTAVAAELNEASGYLRGIDRLSVEGLSTLQARGALPLWWVKKQPGALLLSRGRGRVLVVADPSLLTARGLERDANALFLVNVADRHGRDGKVYFDEYHHGFHSANGFWGYLGHYRRHLALLPPLLVAAAFAWAALVRLGPAVPTPRPTAADAVDYASALARLYQRTGARRLLARTSVRGFLDALTRHLRLRRNALPAEVLAAWRQHDPGPSLARLETLLRGVAELRKGTVSERQLLAWARAFDQFQREMQKQ